MASQANTSLRTQSLNPPLLVLPESAFDRPLPASSTFHSLLLNDRPLFSSHTWTSTSGDIGLLRDADEVEDRAIFVQEYNRLAKKHGIRPLILDDFDPNKPNDNEKPKRGWFRRMFLSSSRLPSDSKDRDPLKSRHRRSASDLAYLIHSRREAPSVLDLQSMVRLSGKSSLYLPTEYAPCALILPTCIRATAQYVSQYANTRGIFRIPGSMKVVGALFDYYCHMDKSGADISGTVRSATLPLHIQYSVHDIASTLKRFLSTIPGGILGSLLLFDSFIAVQSQLNAEPEFPRTNQTKVRARLIALAIGTIESQYRRELICAIFGLLSMIGRIAELAPREDDAGLPLPTTDLMGYGALSICFGPLLVGNLLSSYTMKIATPGSGLVVLPPATQQLRKDTRKNRPGSSTKSVQPAVDKILIANRVTEMLISNWRDIVRQMKSLGTHRRRHTSGGSFSRPSLRPSASETFLTKVPKDFSKKRPSSAIVTRNTTEDAENEFTVLPKSTNAPKRASGFLRQKASINTLSPTMEESPREPHLGDDAVIEEGPKLKSIIPTMDTDSRAQARCTTITEGTRTETDSPVKRKRLTVPPRLSSIESQSQFRPETAERCPSHPSSKENATVVDENQVHAPKTRANSGQGTPPQFYSPVEPAAIPSADRLPREAPNGQTDEMHGTLPNSVLGAEAKPKRNGAQSPATDSKYQLKRYKRRLQEPLTGSPTRTSNLRSAGKIGTHTSGLASAPSDIGTASGLPKSTKGSHPGSPVKANPKRLRRARSGPLTDLTARNDDDVFKPSQRALVGVWRNGVPQKSPTAKVLRSSVSDGVSLRASAIRSLINAGKSRIKKSHTSNEKKRGLYNDEEEPDSWAKCSQDGLPAYEDTQSIIRHLNMYHGCKISPESSQDSEVVAALYHVIISLHDRLIKQEMEVNLLQSGADDKRREEASKLRQDVGIWRRRAESAEKRILVFERFTERLKGIRDAAIASEQPGSQGGEQQGDVLAGSLKLDNDYVAAAARVRFAEVDGNEEQATLWGETSSGHRTSAESRRSKTCMECGEKQNLDRPAVGNRGEGGLRPRPASIDEVAELWMAAKELLDSNKSENE
ncbi:Rho GTPase activation protein [Beauveria brongniartii RCEF 3172]|uniref:Rho GTPase activation protein n=1 Tax=Beauveria brongniartii RCEF 3172 TaxID=1081107 RepID=A0A166WV47_9HYPO|nr:Rho GTPase activation protein [Beauveria brongniartii RCEF 3172]